MYMKICVVGDVLDVITYAKFQNEIFRGYNFTGVEFSIFPIDFEWALQQCSATALPVMSTWLSCRRSTNLRHALHHAQRVVNKGGRSV